MKATELTAAGGRADGYFAVDWAQPRFRSRRRAPAAAADQRRLSREFHRARALAEASHRAGHGVRMRVSGGGMGRVLRGMKFMFNALPPDLALSHRTAEKILEAGGFIQRGAAHSI